MTSVGVVIPCHPSHLSKVKGAVESCKQADKVIVVIDGIYEEVDLPDDIPVSVIATNTPMPCGVCHARNWGISHLDTDLVIPLDADDCFTRNGIYWLVYEWRPGTWTYGHCSQNGIIRRAPYEGMLKRKNLTQATMCFARLDWLRVGGYDPRYNIGAEDWAFQLALTRQGITPQRIDTIVYNYSDGGKRSDFGDYMNVIMELLRLDYGITPSVYKQPDKGIKTA